MNIGDVIFDSEFKAEGIILSIQKTPAMDKVITSYTVKYFDEKIKGGLFQSVEEKEISYTRKPTVSELKFMQQGRNELFERELENYELEYKNQSNSYELLISNLKYYNFLGGADATE